MLGNTDEVNPVSISRGSNHNERDHETNRNLNTMDGVCLLNLPQTRVGQQQQQQNKTANGKEPSLVSAPSDLLIL